MSDFDAAFRRTLDAEGGYVDHPDDPGGKTNLGITQGLAARYGFPDVRELTKADARAIYRSEFWEPLRLGELDSQAVAEELYDTATNMGRRAAVELAQKAANLLGEQITVDGRIGPETLGALNALSARYELHLVAAMNGYQFVRYVSLYEADPKRRRSFIAGWMRRTVTRAEGLA